MKMSWLRGIKKSPIYDPYEKVHTKWGIRLATLSFQPIVIESILHVLTKYNQPFSSDSLDTRRHSHFNLYLKWSVFVLAADSDSSSIKSPFSVRSFDNIHNNVVEILNPLDIFKMPKFVS